MPTIDEIRSAAPWTQGLSDVEILDHAAKMTGQPLEAVAADFGVKLNQTRNPLAVANDTVIEAVNAGVGGIKAVGDFVSPGNSMSQGIAGLMRQGERSQSLPVQYQKHLLNQALDSGSVGEELKGVGRYVVNNPLLSAAQAAGNIAVPGAAIKGARGAAGLMRLGDQAIARAGIGTSMGVSAAMGGGDAAGDAYDAVMNSQALADVPLAQRQIMATDAARKASVVPAAIGAFTGRVGAEGALARNVSKGVLKTAGEEFLSEGFEEGATKLSANLAASQYDPSIQAFKGVAGASALGGVMGAGTGAATAVGLRQPKSLLPGANPNAVNTDGTQNTAVPQLGYNPNAGAMTVFPDGSVATSEEAAFQRRYAPQSSDGSFDYAPVGFPKQYPEAPYNYQNAVPWEPTHVLPGATPTQANQTQVPLMSGQPDMFDPLHDQANGPAMVEQESAPVEQDTQTLPLFHNARDAEITAVLRNANGGRANKNLLTFAQRFKQAMNDPQQLEDLLANTKLVSGDVVEKAAELAEIYRSQALQMMRDRNSESAEPTTTLADQIAEPTTTLADQIADTDARVAGAEQQRAQAERLDILNRVLDDPTTKNPAARFQAALRKLGYTNTVVSEQELARIQRHEDIRTALADTVEHTPNEMDVESLVPEKKVKVVAPAPTAKRGNPLTNPAYFELTKSPGPMDVAAIERAEAKRDRKAATQAESEAPAPTAKGQGELFTKRGEPTAKADWQRQQAKAENKAAPAAKPATKPAPTKKGPDAAAKTQDTRKKASPPTTTETTNEDLTSNVTESPEQQRERLTGRLNKLISGKTALDLQDEAAIADAIERGDFDEAKAKLHDVETAIRERRYRTQAQAAPANAISHSALERIVASIERALGGHVSVAIMDDVTQFDPKQRPGSRAGVMDRGNIILFRSGIASGIEGQKTIFHELFHKGLRKLLSPGEYTGTLNRLYNSSAEIRAMADAYLNSATGKADTAGMNTADARALAVDEALAERAETLDLKPNTIRQMGNWLADVADRLGLKQLAQWLRSAPMSQLDTFIRDTMMAGMQVSINSGTNFRPGTSAFDRWLGNYDPTNPDIRYRTVTEARESMADVLKYDVLDRMRRGKLGFAFLRNIAEKYQGKLASVAPHVKSVLSMGATAEAYRDSALKVQDALDALPAAHLKQVTELMADATVANVAIEGTNAHLAPKERVAAQALKDRFDVLTSQQKTAYRLARDTAKKFWADRAELIKATSNSIYKPLLDDARAAGDTKKVKVLERELNAYLAETDRLLNSLSGDYFPLLRHGDWLVVRKSKEFTDLQKQRDAAFDHLNTLLDKYEVPRDRTQAKQIRAYNKKLEKAGEEPLGNFTPEQAEEIKQARSEYHKLESELEAMKGKEGHYYVAAYERKSEAVADQRNNGGELSLKQDHHRELNPITRAALGRLEESMAATMRGAGNVEALRDAKRAMYQIFLTQLPDRSAMKREAKRKNVAGFDRDMKRNMAQSMMTDSFYLSRLKHMDDVMGTLNAVRTEARESGDAHLQEVGEELARRQAKSMEFVDTPLQDKASAWTYFATLGASPGFLLSNMLQPFMVSAPMLMARHSGSISAMGKAWAEVAALTKSSLGTNKRGEIRYTDAPFTPGEKVMLDALKAQRLITTTLTHDLTTIADGGKAAKWAQRVAAPGHYIEVLNRMSTALAAYRLELAKTGNEAMAQSYAERVLADTHFDYSTENSPYWMKPGAVPVGKLLFQFKKYQAAMIALYAKNISHALKGETPEVRREARRTLLGLFATTGAMAGSFGLPGMGAVMMVANLIAKAFGDDDDEPFDAEVEYRNWLVDVVGDKTVADVLVKGLPTLLGADLSKKIGSGDLIPNPDVGNSKNSRDAYKELLASSAGPFLGGILPRWFDGVDFMMKGDVTRAAESFLPKMLADPVKAWRFGNDGVTTRRGNVMVGADELSSWDLFLQASGVTPMEMSDAYDARNAIENRKQAISSRAQTFKEQWATAFNKGDTDKTSSLQDRLAKLNESRTASGFKPITYSELLKAAKTQQDVNRSYQTTGGAVGKNAKLAEQARFAQEE